MHIPVRRNDGRTRRDKVNGMLRRMAVYQSAGAMISVMQPGAAVARQEISASEIETRCLLSHQTAKQQQRQQLQLLSASISASAAAAPVPASIPLTARASPTSCS